MTQWTRTHTIAAIAHSWASDVSYDPASCDHLAGTATVQEAIDVLCKTAPTQDDKGIHVEKILFQDGS